VSAGKFKNTFANDQASPRRILTSWKEIGLYTGKGIRTVQRREVSLRFPVRRRDGHRKSFVIAFTDEIDSWWRSQFTQCAEGGSKSELQPLRGQNAQLQAEIKSLRRMLGQ